MDFLTLKNELALIGDDIRGIHTLLKESIGAKHIDLFFYNNSKNIFFDKINNIYLDKKFLDETSLVGQAFLSRKGGFYPNVQEIEAYNLALDNPFKIEIKNQIVLPVFEKNTPKGIIRLSQFPRSFSRSDYMSLVLLMPVFRELFRHTLHERVEVESKPIESLDVFEMIHQMRDLFGSLSDKSTNPEVSKLIMNGEQNISTILTYLDLNSSKVSSIGKEVVNLTCENGEEKKITFNILIADDIKINVRILNAMLAKNTKIDNINHAYDGLETLEVIQKCKDCDESINVLFLDHHMPGLLGTEVAKTLRSDEKFNHKNIVIVSITNDPEAIEENQDLYNYHLPKPFTRQNIDTIMSKIRSHNE